MLRTKLFRGIALLVLTIGLLSGFIGIRIIMKRTVAEAQHRVQFDLSSAWSVINAQLREMESILKLAARKSLVKGICEGDTSDIAEKRSQLEVIRRDFGFDFLTLVSARGQVVQRAAAPFNQDDYCLASPQVENALKGSSVAGIMLFSARELDLEAAGLAETAFINFKETRHARSTPKSEEQRGMVMIAAVPVVEGMRVVGVIYGGVLLNRDDEIIDEISSAVYRDESYLGAPMGTATIFLMDSRITTTVREPNGNRAIGTRVSAEVANRVLDNGLSWIGPAFVVNRAYLSAYDPIRNFDGEIIGMLYVGILEEPFKLLSRQLIMRFGLVLIFGLAAALVLAFFWAGRLSCPIHRMVEAATRMRHGDRHTPIEKNGACNETETLIDAFNDMAKALEERETNLREANDSLNGLNRSYMDMLGFVSHELKSPVSSIMNYIYILQQKKQGELTPKQEKAVANIESSAKRIVEMVRHYLNLSRIENTELQPVRTDIAIGPDIVVPLLEELEADIDNRNMRVENNLADDVVIFADTNMTREVFENLLSNAIKYGCESGLIRIECKDVGESLQFVVGNEGEGITSEEKLALFKKFSRIEGSGAVRRQKGTGLGLFITKHIIEAHGGTIEVLSTPGEWTEFRFTFPKKEVIEEAK